VITDLIQIRRLGEKRRDENLHFRRWIKSHVFVERQFRRTAEEIHAQIDCRQCAECCRVTEVELSERDIEKLMKYLRLPRKKFIEAYTGTGEDGTLILKRTAEKGCVFLDGNDITHLNAAAKEISDFLLANKFIEKPITLAGVFNSRFVKAFQP